MAEVAHHNHHDHDVAALTRALVRRGAVIGTDIVARSGLHPTDVRALQLLDRAGEEPATPGELADALRLSRPAVSALLDRLESAALVERHPDPHDRRRIRIHLAPAAGAIGAEHLRPLAAAIDRAAAELEPTDTATISRYLSDLLHSLD